VTSLLCVVAKLSKTLHHVKLIRSLAPEDKTIPLS